MGELVLAELGLFDLCTQLLQQIASERLKVMYVMRSIQKFSFVSFIHEVSLGETLRLTNGSSPRSLYMEISEDLGGKPISDKTKNSSFKRLQREGLKFAFNTAINCFSTNFNRNTSIDTPSSPPSVLFQNALLL